MEHKNNSLSQSDFVVFIAIVTIIQWEGIGQKMLVYVIQGKGKYCLWIFKFFIVKQYEVDVFVDRKYFVILQP